MDHQTISWLPLLIAAGSGGYYYWLQNQPKPLPEGIAASNSRIETVEIDLAARIADRLVDVQVNSSIPLFFAGKTLHLFATTSIGIFMATFTRSVPQCGLLLLPVLMQMLSGGTTPRESMPEIVQNIILAAPTTHFVQLAQAILYRDAGFAIVWPQFAALALIGAVFFGVSQSRFRKVIGTTA